MFVADTRIEDPAWSRAIWPGKDGLASHIEAALDTTARHLELSGTIAILFTSDSEMRRLNATWRAIDRPTDILSFSADAETLTPEEPRFLGDLALGWGCFERDAHTLRRPIHLHLRHLLVHGLLHLLGHDHKTTDETRLMEGLERTILGEIGLSDPYEVIEDHV